MRRLQDAFIFVSRFEIAERGEQRDDGLVAEALWNLSHVGANELDVIQGFTLEALASLGEQIC
jgi:hypothetical protein